MQQKIVYGLSHIELKIFSISRKLRNVNLWVLKEKKKNNEKYANY